MGTTARRCVVAALAALLPLPLVSAAAAAATPAARPAAVTPGPSDWPTDRYNNQRINANLAETQLSPSNVGQLHLAWSTPPRDVPNSPITDTYMSYNPIVVGDDVYAGCGYDLCAFDRTTGAVKWQTRVQQEGLALLPIGPTYGDGLLFTGSTFGLVALDPSTGNQVWATSFASNATPVDRVLYSPVYDDGKVFVSMTSGALHAVDAATGNPLWTYTQEGQPELAAYNGILYAEFGPHDEQTGEAAVGQGGAGWPGPAVISDDRVFVGLTQMGVVGNHDIYLPVHHSPTDGTPPYWTPQGPPAIANHTLYYSGEFGTGFGQGPPQLNALKITDPFYGGFAHDWQTVLPASATYAWSPTVANGVVYSVTTSGQIYAASATTGALLWMYSTDSPMTTASPLSTPVVADGMLFVQTGNRLFAFTTDPGDHTGVPAQPTELITTDGDGQASLAWNEPSTAGAATSYRITVQPSGRVVTSGGTAVTVSGLNDWTHYTFAITPLNAAGAGPALVTPPVTPRPEVTIATVRSNGHVALYGAGKWRSLGGQATSAPAVVTVGGDPYVFVRGPDYRIWVRGTDTTWQLFGPTGTCASGPAATATDDGTIEVACRATDNHLLAATSPVPAVGGLPHASVWTYNALTLRGRPSIGKWDDPDQVYDTVIAARSTTSDKLQFVPSNAFGGPNGPAACGASPALADSSTGATRGWACEMPYEKRQPRYLEVETFTTATPGPTPLYPFAGQIGMAVIDSGPVVVGVSKTGRVIAQIQPPSAWGVTPWPPYGTPDKPVFVTIGKHTKYGAAAAATYHGS